VTTEAPILDVSDSPCATTINTEQLQDLPVAGRNFLIWCSSSRYHGHGRGRWGSSRRTSGQLWHRENSDAAVTAATSSGNQLLWTFEHYQQHSAKGLPIDAERDSIRELTVQTNLFNVEHGRGKFGSNRNDTKSGTNAYHGSEHKNYGRDLASNPAYEPFKKSDVAGTFGGPIIKITPFAFCFRGTSARPNFAGGIAAHSESPEFR